MICCLYIFAIVLPHFCKFWKFISSFFLFLFYFLFFLSRIFSRFSWLILLAMFHWRSQVPTTLVPINQQKYSQSHAKEYNKRILVGSSYYCLFKSHSFGAHNWKLNAVAKAITELILILLSYVWVGFIGAVFSVATIFSYKATLSPPKKWIGLLCITLKCHSWFFFFFFFYESSC